MRIRYSQNIQKIMIAGAVFMLCSPLLAQQSDNVEEVVVTSSRIPVPKKQLSTSVSVITEDEIEAHGNLTLVDIMRQSPSIGTSNNGGAGKTTTMRVRGEEGFRTLVVLDGMRLLDSSATQIAVNMEHLLSSGIGRVEILRGPQGLSYGADAGGIVNITSRRTEDGLIGTIEGQAGEFGTRQVAGNLSGAGEQGDFFVSLTDFQTDGFNTREDDDQLMDDDGYDNTTVHLRGGLNVSDQLRIQVVHRDSEGEAQVDGCGFPTVHDCDTTFELQATRVSLDYTSEDFTHSVSYATVDTFRDYFTEGVSSFTGDGELNRIEYIGTATGLDGFDLVFGADHEEAVNNDEGRDNLGLYVDYLSDFSKTFFITAGARYDDNDDFGTNTSVRLSGSYLIDLDDGSTVKLRSSYGTGFRAPSPAEIAYNVRPGVYPPASEVVLQQESSEGYEFGVEYATVDGLQLEAVYFDQEVEDAIEFDLATYSGYLQEPGISTSKGVELIGEVPLSPTLMLKANYTYNEAETADGSPRLRRPEQLFNVGLSWYGMQDRLNVNGFIRASRDAVDSGGDLEDFEVVDLTAQYKFTDTIQLFGRIENLLDEDYQEILSYNTPGRAAYFGFRINFSQ